jgi:hypothetical protein
VNPRVSDPAETPPGDYIEAALYALEANRPGLALRYLREAVAQPEYGPLGLNHTLRIDGLGYVYDPHRHVWTHDGWTPSGTYTPDHLTAEEIHAIILEGRHRVTVWEVSS